MRATLIGAVFGLVYVVVNAGAVPGAASVVLRVLAIAALVGVLMALQRTGATRPGDGVGSGRAAFGRGYWTVLAAEVVTAVAGNVVVTRILPGTRAPLAWVTFIVGVHFFGLAAVWRLGFFRRLGAVLAVLGAAGLVLAATGARDATVAVVAGVAPGLVLLAVAYRVPLRRRHTGAGAAAPPPTL